MADEIGVFYTPVQGVPGAWHAGVYYKRNYGNRLTRTPETLDAHPEHMPGGPARIFEYGREKLLGERPSDTPFGRLVKRPGLGFPDDAIHDPLIHGLDLGRYWNGLHSAFDELDGGDFLYHPALQNSNSVVAAALAKNGITWTRPKIWANPRDPGYRPGDPPYRIDPSYPWVPGAERPLVREQDVQRPAYNTTPMGDVTGFPRDEVEPTRLPGLVSGQPMQYWPVQLPLFDVK